MNYCQIFGGQTSLLELQRDSLVLLRAAWVCGWMLCSSYAPSLELSNPLLHIFCLFKEALSLGMTVGNRGFGNQKVEEADMKQNKDFSVLCFFFCLFFS